MRLLKSRRAVRLKELLVDLWTVLRLAASFYSEGVIVSQSIKRPKKRDALAT
jgi:hypothetical protein